MVAIFVAILAAILAAILSSITRTYSSSGSVPNAEHYSLRSTCRNGSSPTILSVFQYDPDRSWICFPFIDISMDYLGSSHLLDSPTSNVQRNPDTTCSRILHDLHPT